MIRKEEVYKIGIFNKPHGIHGELSFTFTDDIFDRVEAEYLICLLYRSLSKNIVSAQTLRLSSNSKEWIRQNAHGCLPTLRFIFP